MATANKRGFAKKMLARDRGEGHRPSTPLELFFDLVSVIAIASIAQAFHHSISAGHGLEILPRFILLFTSVWWAWMNFTWFASAFDNDDVVYRLAVMVLIAGEVLFAGAAVHGMETLDFSYAVLGWIIMRLAMIFLWLRVARHNKEFAKTANRYALNLLLVQGVWVFILLAPFLPRDPLSFYAMWVGVLVLELAAVYFAERIKPTSWHRHHIIERFGLLNIIVLGEVLLALTGAVKYGVENHFSVGIVAVVAGGVVVTFALWWLYFLEEEHLISEKLPHAFVWSYGHVFIFLAGASVGIGFGAVIDVLTHHSKISLETAQIYATVPIALYLAGLWLVRDRHYLKSTASLVMLGAVAAIILSNLTPYALVISGIILVGLLAFRMSVQCKASDAC